MEWSDEELARRVAEDLPESDRAEALALLMSYGAAPHEREGSRVRRVLLQSCNRSMERLRRLLVMAQIDYRDILTRDPGPDGSFR